MACRSGYGRTMSHSLSCGDVMPGCAATFEAETQDDLMQQVSKHAADDHGVTEITPEIGEAVKAAIKTS